MKYKKYILLPAIMLVCTLLFAFFATLTPAYASGDGSGTVGNNSSVAYVSSADILEYFLSSELCEAEREYLIACGGEDIRYNDGVNTSSVEIEYNREGGSLRVFASCYSFTTDRGTELSFIPDTATILGRDGDITIPLSLQPDGRYYGYFDEVYDTADTAAVRVKYTLTLEVSHKCANRLVNLAYDDASRLSEEFSQRSEEYRAAKERYDAYIPALREYEEKKPIYDEYISELEAYEEARREWEEYLADYAEYLSAKSAYEKYEADLKKYKEDLSLYSDYSNKYEIYLSELERYEAYLERYEACSFRLSAFELLGTKMSALKRSAKAAIEGGLVDTVLAERDSLESGFVGAPSAVIDLAGDATVRLRRLMADYFSLSTESTRYAYYVKNYAAMESAVVDLFISLDYLYSNATIRAAIIETGKAEKYRILLAELFLAATALSDNPILSVPREMVAGTVGYEGYKQFTYTEEYETAGGYSVLEILGGDSLDEYIVDIDMARPSANDEGYPAVVERPTEPARVDEPVMPSEPSRPILPDEVSDPGDAPQEVEEPICPEFVENPGDAPMLSALEAMLVSAYEGGEILPRDITFDAPKKYEITRTVSKKYVSEDFALVRFFDGDGGSELFSTRVDIGDSVYYDGVLPSKAEDVGYTYIFDHWKNADGELVNLKQISGSVSLYPEFKAIKKSYLISWNIDGEITSVSVPYGDIPVCPTVPHRPSEDSYKYVFSGWDKAVVSVSENAEYRAEFDREYLIKHGGGGATLTYGESGALTVDYGSVYDTDYDLGSVLKFSGTERAITLKADFFDINISKVNVKRLVADGADRLSIRLMKQSGRASVAVFIYDDEGREITPDYKLTVSVPLDGVWYSEDSLGRLHLSTLDADGAAKYHKFSVSDGVMSFALTPSLRYELSYEYKINAVSHSMVTVRTDKEISTVGETVFIEYEVAAGAVLDGLYYENAAGERTRLSGNSFVMPSEDVNVIAVVRQPVYRIAFTSEGSVITTQYLKQGELPTAPEQPIKAASATHTYRFVGWTPEISAVTGEKTYSAVFEAVPIALDDGAEDDGGLTLYEKALLIAFLGVPVALATLAFIVMKIRR